VRHIDLRLDDDIDVRMLADMACFSPYHFLRVFQDLTEETPLSMVRRLRLERSRKRLLAGGSIREAADEARFESAQAFCRAFRSIFGVTPSKVANGEIRIKATDIPPAIVSIPSRRSISVDFRGAGEALSGEFGHLLGLARPLIQRFPVAVAKASQDDPFAEPGSQCNCRMLVMMPEGCARRSCRSQPSKAASTQSGASAAASSMPVPITGGWSPICCRHGAIENPMRRSSASITTTRRWFRATSSAGRCSFPWFQP
jgi:AraC-like DNA-binding protein